MLVLAISTLFATPVYAAIGDNIGGGGGSGGSGVTDGRYTYPMSEPQGYRVTLIKANGTKVKAPIDITNDVNFANNVKQHFGKNNKLDYISGSPISEKKFKYTYIETKNALPRVVGSGSNGYEEVKTWFTRPENLKWLCQSDKLNFDYNLLIDSPDYKLLIEPLVYINIASELYAMTATEGIKACQADSMVSYNLAAVLRRQAPISLFLAKDDNAVGISAYAGQTNLGDNQYVNNVSAIAQLGIGIIYFNDEETPPVDPTDPTHPPSEVGKYRYDFSCDKLSISTNPIREENDFNASTTFSYQQEIDCKYCVTTCSQCNLTGKYQVKISDGYRAHYSSCDVFNTKPCNCGGYWVPAVYETHLCNKCYINCSHCDLGKLWYKKGSEYATPTKSTTVEVFVKDARLDYKRGISGVLKYTKTVTLSADSTISVNALLNAGEDIGIKSVVSRINWDAKNTEHITDNNSLATSVEVIPATNLQIEYVIPNAGFRTDTDVISSFLVLNQDDIGALNVRPKHNLEAIFKATNPKTNEVIATSVVNKIVVPKGGTNLVYFKWHVPKDYTADTVTLQCELNPSHNVNETSYDDNTAIAVNGVEKFKQQIPPDTIFENRPSSFVKPSGLEVTPTKHITSSVLSGINYECWEWSSDYVKRNYIINLSASYDLKPDDKSPSHKLLASNVWQMRSGYGVELSIIGNLSGNLPSSNAYTTVQNGNAYLPEYRFKVNKESYRTLEQTSPNVLNFPRNPFTITDKGIQDFKRVHFSPLWYPDGEYKLKTYIYDVWTPIGMLSTTQDVSSITIEGDMYKDWYLSHARKRE